MDLHLQGRLAVITGAARGIGEAFARAFAGEGARLLLIDRDEAVSGLSKALGGESVTGDLAAPGFDSSIAVRAAELGGASILVNNAGISRPSALRETADRDWNEVMDINAGVQFRLIRALWDQLAANSGAVVNVASFAAKRSTLFGNNCSYVASKHAVAGLTRAAAFEGAAQGVRINAIAPGVVDTEMVRLHDEATRERIRSFIPQGRFAEPSEIADLALFLASDRAGHICGEVVGINGGLHMD